MIEADFLGQPSLQRTEADVVLPIAVRDEEDPVLSHASGAVVEKEGAGTAAAIEAQLLVQDSGFGCRRRAEHHHAAGGSGHQHSEGDEKPRANTRITAPNHDVSLLGCCWLFRHRRWSSGKNPKDMEDGIIQKLGAEQNGTKKNFQDCLVLFLHPNHNCNIHLHSYTTYNPTLKTMITNII